MEDYTSIIITYEGNFIWTFRDNTMDPSGEPQGNDANSGSFYTDGTLTFKTKTGGITYNRQPYTIFSYVDSTDAGNNFTPTSALAFLVYLKSVGFFDSGSGGAGDPTTFLDLTDTPANYFGYGGQAVVVNEDETGLEFVTFNNAERSTDLLDMPQVLGLANKGKFLVVNSLGTGYILMSPSVIIDPPIASGTMKWRGKGYQFLGSEPIENVSLFEQVGDWYEGSMKDDLDDPESSIRWYPACRWLGGDKNIPDNFEWSVRYLSAFPTEPDYPI